MLHRRRKRRPLSPSGGRVREGGRNPMSHMRLDDDTLTETGLAAPRSEDVSGRVLLIACGALAREILALTRLNGWSHLDLACLPAKLHNVPQQIPEAVRAKDRKSVV